MKKNIKLKGLLLLLFVSILTVGCSPERKPEVIEDNKKEEVVKEEKVTKEDLPKKELPLPASQESKEKDYLYFLLINNDKLNEHLTNFSNLFGDNMVVDEDFMQSLALNVDGIKDAGYGIIEYEEVPKKYEQVHLYYVESMKYYTEAMDDVVLAVENNFTEVYMVSAMENLELGGAYLDEATSLLQETID